jgi:hypothetical protein
MNYLNFIQFAKLRDSTCEPVNNALLPLLESSEIYLDFRVYAHLRRIPCILYQLAGSDQSLAWNAADIDANSTQLVFLNQNNILSQLSESNGSNVSPRA